MIVTLLTDFGTQDYFVGAMKGALLSVNSNAQIVDITHEIPPHDIQAGAFTLRAAFESFPRGTIHVAVVDPGVGSSRRPIVVSAEGHIFVGPDNGVFGHVYERLENLRVFHVTNEKYFRADASATFHGRDIFAPVAGALSLGIAPVGFGPQVTDFMRLPFAKPALSEDGTLVGAVIHVDRFGNCITNISPRELAVACAGRKMSLNVGDAEVRDLRRFFADEGEASGEPFAIWGSAGLLELAVYKDSAARILGIERGARIEIQSSRAKKTVE